MVSVLAAVATAVAVGAVGLLVMRLERAGRPRSRRTHVEGLDVPAFQFWLAVLGVAGVTFAVVYGLTGLLVVSAIPALVVATLPRAYFSRTRARRLAQVAEAWPDGLRDILSTVRSGGSLPTAVENLSLFGPPALRDAFQGFGVYSRSLGVVPALEIVKQDLADPTSDRVIEVLILAYERGGPVVAEILTDLAEATTRDLWTMEEVRTEALEHKINARVVFVLPWLVLVAMTARSGAFREFYSTRIGILVAVVGGVMSLVGIVIASRLGSTPDEPRVLAR
jgi:tight adherence protein B